MADGTVCDVSGRKIVKVSDLVLDSHLCVPNFSYNLLSISKLSEDSNCTVAI